MNRSARFGKYHLLDKIGTGGMAELFLAKQTGLSGFEKVVAIKRILPHLIQSSEFINMFVNEAKLAALLSHQNIVQIYDLGNIDSAYFIAMEYIMGKDLRTLLTYAQSRKLPPSIGDILIVTSKICSALDYAHRKKDLNGGDLHLVHRDISPQNILVSYEGEVKLVDFGIAKAAVGVQETKTGVLKGKLAYMSPEQAWGKPIDHRTDIFALGIVLYEALTGQRLFTGNNEISILEKVRQAEVPAPTRINSDIPSELELVLLKSLAKEPENRYQSASEMQMALENLITQKGYAFSSLSLSNYMKVLYEEEIAKDTRRIRLLTSGESPPPPIEDRSTVVRPPKPIHPSPEGQRSRSSPTRPLPAPRRGDRVAWMMSILFIFILFFFLLSDLTFIAETRSRLPLLEAARDNVQTSLKRIGIPPLMEGSESPSGSAETARSEPPPDPPRQAALQDQPAEPHVSAHILEGPPPQDEAAPDRSSVPAQAPPAASSDASAAPSPPASAGKSISAIGKKTDLDLLYLEAKESYNAGHFDEVEKKLRRIIEIDPNAVTAYHLLGTIYRERKDYDTALRIFSDASALFPADARLHYDLGFLYFEKEIDSLTRQELTKALALAPEAPGHLKARNILRKIAPGRQSRASARVKQKSAGGDEAPSAAPPPPDPPPATVDSTAQEAESKSPAPLSAAEQSPQEEQQQIRQLIARQKRALQAKNLDDFFQDHLSPDSRIEQKIKNWFPRFDALSVNYEIYELKVEGPEASASILETIVLQSGESPRQVEKALVYWKFAKVEKSWKIVQTNIIEQYSPPPERRK